MQKLTLTAICLVLTFFAIGQNLQMDIYRMKLADFIKLEDSLGSEKVKPRSEYMSGPGIAQPEIYRRKESKVPDMLSYYFYHQKDSSIDYVLYEWDESNFTGYKENSKKTEAEVVNFIEKYNQIYSEIAKKFGDSDSTGDILNISLVGKGMTRQDNWRPNDSIRIQLYTTLSSRYEKKGMITINPTYRIRLYVRSVRTR
jgi:hypothetical protein